MKEGTILGKSRNTQRKASPDGRTEPHRLKVRTWLAPNEVEPVQEGHQWHIQIQGCAEGFAALPLFLELGIAPNIGNRKARDANAKWEQYGCIHLLQGCPASSEEADIALTLNKSTTSGTKSDLFEFRKILWMPNPVDYRDWTTQQVTNAWRIAKRSKTSPDIIFHSWGHTLPLCKHNGSWNKDTSILLMSPAWPCYKLGWK